MQVNEKRARNNHEQANIKKIAYWSIPILLILIQLVFTLKAFGQMRNEEVIESVRSVWWFQNALVTDGGYSNLGWYTLLLIFYKVFGFTIHTAKFAKLFIEALSFFALAAILKKYLGVKYAWMPLLIIGLSPTFLFLNTLQISHGIEVNYFLICFLLIDFLNFKSSKLHLPQQGLAWSLAMFAWMSYPSFIYYLPILGFYYLYKLSNSRQFILKNVSLSLVSFLLPLILGFLYIENRHLLLYDRIPQRGLFRSNGGFELSMPIFLDNLNILKNDLFLTYDSYYYENPKVEFSDIYPIAAILIVLGLSVYIFIKNKKYRLLTGAMLSLISVYLVALNLIGPPGLGGVRRVTSVLLLFYGLCAVNLYYFTRIDKNSELRFLSIGACGILLVHHTLVYPANLAHLKIPTPYAEKFWFYQAKTPEESLNLYLEKVQKEELTLICHDMQQKPVSCEPVGGYSLIDSAVKGSCNWNNLLCHSVSAYDIKLGKFVPLDFHYWDGNNWGR